MWNVSIVTDEQPFRIYIPFIVVKSSVFLVLKLISCLFHSDAHRWMLALGWTEHQQLDLGQSKQDVRVIISYRGFLTM